MAQTGFHRPPETPGLVSLAQTLLGGAVLLLVGAGYLLLAPGPAIPRLADVPGATDAPVPVTTVANGDTGEGADGGLPVAVRGPARLVPGRPTPLHVRVGDSATPLDTDRPRLRLSFDLDLRREARGWVVVDPPRLLTSPDGLPGEEVALTGLDEIPCGTRPGTLTVTAHELVEDGRSGRASYEIPEVACPGDDVPDAPESLNLQQRVWHGGTGDWRAQVARLLAPVPTTATRSSSPRPSTSGAGAGPEAEQDKEDDDAESAGDGADEEDSPGERTGDADGPEPESGDTVGDDDAPREADGSDAWEPAPDDGDGTDAPDEEATTEADGGTEADSGTAETEGDGSSETVGAGSDGGTTG